MAVVTAPVPRSIGAILFSWDGRISRLTFWIVWASLMAGGVPLGALLVLAAANHVRAALALAVVVAVPTTWIWLAMHVKRWHDRNKSGWMVLILLLPVVGDVWSFIELGFLRGTTGPNQYGEDPLAARPGRRQPVTSR